MSSGTISRTRSERIVSSKFDRFVETEYAYQELDGGLGDFPLPPDREKPWGTGHAILVSRDAIHEPFAVVNADDYYGVDSLKTIAAFLTTRCRSRTTTPWSDTSSGTP